MEEYGGGNFSILNDDEVVAPEELGRRVRPRQENVQEDPPVISIDDEMLMNWCNVEVRRYQDDLGRSMNYNHWTLAYLFYHLNIPPMDEPYFPVLVVGKRG